RSARGDGSDARLHHRDVAVVGAQRGARLTDNLGDGPAIDPLGAAAPVGDDAVGVSAHDRIGDVVDDGRALAHQLLFGAFAGDVGELRDEPDHSAVVSAHRRSTYVDLHPAAVVPADPVVTTNGAALSDVGER